MEEAKKICVYSGTAHPQLAQDIAEYLGITLGKIHPMRFPDGETFVQFEENVRRADVFLIQPTCNPPNDNIMELLIMIDAMKRASAGRINAVIPYYGYARQDRKARARDPITAKLVADMLVAAGADYKLAYLTKARPNQLTGSTCSPTHFPFLMDSFDKRSDYYIHKELWSYKLRHHLRLSSQSIRLRRPPRNKLHNEDLRFPTQDLA